MALLPGPPPLDAYGRAPFDPQAMAPLVYSIRFYNQGSANLGHHAESCAELRWPDSATAII